ncbi:DNA-binding GntR family transcriptional regulator [Brevirhabdus pacifica]|nr:GntR family transcriptional regulator [Brevirhabdus pacifica]PJJ87084.1 DNA-binding GntR family transcriptional regulator [Brevirhabdus pacifica]
MAMNDTPPSVIGRTALAVEVTDRLRQMILEGRLKPGEKIREKLLTEEFGVSRTPLREALKVLASEGLLELIPNRGAIISRQSDAEREEIFLVLSTLEGLAGELACEAATDEELQEIARLTDALRPQFEARDRRSYFSLNQAIHNAILNASHNETLIRSHALLAYRVQRARYQANPTAHLWERAVDEHEAIARTLLARDGARTRLLMTAHLRKLSSLTAEEEAGRGPGPGAIAGE